MPLPVPKSRRAWRLEVKKLRRRRIRQAAAQLRQSNPSKGIPKLSGKFPALITVYSLMFPCAF